MSYNILAITPAHNSSVTLVSDGKVIFYLEEERLTRNKMDSIPFKTLSFLLKKYEIHEAYLTGAGDQSSILTNGRDLYETFLHKYQPNIKFYKVPHDHHLFHASIAFYNSGFDKALSVVIDGNGSSSKVSNLPNEPKLLETETTYIAEYPNNFTRYKSNFQSYKTDIVDKDKNITISSLLSIGKIYNAVTRFLGFQDGEEGKVMGLSSYGNPPFVIPKLLGNKNLFEIKDEYPLEGKFISPNLEDSKYSFLNNPSLKDAINLSYRVQKDTENFVGDYIEEIVLKTGIKKICCAGGVFLNCVNNYQLKKRFPEIKFYFEPIAHDGGVSMGAALHKWHKYSKSKITSPQKTLYYGPKYSKEELLEGIKKYT